MIFMYTPRGYNMAIARIGLEKEMNISYVRKKKKMFIRITGILLCYKSIKQLTNENTFNDTMYFEK